MSSFETKDQAGRLYYYAVSSFVTNLAEVLYIQKEENVTNDISKKAHVDFKSLQIMKRLESYSRLCLLFYVFCLKLKSSSYAFEVYFWNRKTLHRPCKCKLVFVEFNICMFWSGKPLASQSQLNHQVQHHTIYDYYMFHYPTQRLQHYLYFFWEMCH